MFQSLKKSQGIYGVPYAYSLEKINMLKFGSLFQFHDSHSLETLDILKFCSLFHLILDKIY